MTPTMTTNNEGFQFAKPKVKKLKPIACLGVLTPDSIGECKESQNNPDNWVQKITIKGIAGSADAYLNLTYRPEYLTKGFDPEEYFGEASDFVYRVNIYDPSGKSLLQGICGNPENFRELQSMIGGLTEVTMDSFRNVLLDYARAHEGEKIGFYRTQKSEKNADGKYEQTEKYEAGRRWWNTDEDGFNYVTMQIDKGDVIAGFDTSIPF